jgi:hypothetical protein
MKKCNTNKKQKLNLGGYVQAGTNLLQGFANMDTGKQDSLWQDILLKQSRQLQDPTYIPNPNSALARNDISKAKAKYDASTDSFTQILDIIGTGAMGLGSDLMGAKSGNVKGGEITDPDENGINTGGFSGFMNKIFGGQKGAYGGQVASNVPVEVEGKEVAQTPDGQMLDFQGPSHEQGGIDVALPEGTEVYSKRVKGPDGKSMADRKKAREKQIANLEKLIAKNPGDKNLRKTLEKTLKNFDAQEKEDMQKMQMAQEVQELQGMVQEFMTGGKVKKYNNGGKIPYYLQNPEYNMFPQEKYTGVPFIEQDNIPYGPKRADYTPIEKISDTQPDYLSKLIGQIKLATPIATKKGQVKVKADGTGGGATAGDIVGMLGQAYNTFEPMKNTLTNRAGDTPNINMFRDYGKDGLKTVDDMKQYVNQIRDTQLEDLNLNRTTASNRNRNTARGVNTMRALDLATDSNINNSQNQIYAQFAQAMQGILGQQAGMQNQKDQVVMGGEQARDLADRHDRDNFFSQMARDIATKGFGMQNIGKSLNEIKARKVSGKAINNLSDNFNVNINTGNISKIRSGEPTDANYMFLKSLPPAKMKLIEDGIAEVKNGKLVKAGTNEEIKD